jgi:hypothetical protein
MPIKSRAQRIAGQLRSGVDVVATDVSIGTWFPGQAIGRARFALVGLGIAQVPEDRYHKVRLQLTGSDLFFGTPPLKAPSVPAEGQPHLNGQFTATGNPESSHHWSDSDINIDCSYDYRFSAGDPYQFNLRFAPVITLSSTVSLTVDEWFNTWLIPTIRIGSMATKQPQHLAWVTAHSSEPERSAMIFASGIPQAPFQAEYRMSGEILHIEHSLSSLPYRCLFLNCCVSGERWKSATTHLWSYTGLPCSSQTCRSMLAIST